MLAANKNEVQWLVNPYWFFFWTILTSPWLKLYTKYYCDAFNQIRINSELKTKYETYAGVPQRDGISQILFNFEPALRDLTIKLVHIKQSHMVLKQFSSMKQRVKYRNALWKTTVELKFWIYVPSSCWAWSRRILLRQQRISTRNWAFVRPIFSNLTKVSILLSCWKVLI